MIWLRSCAHRSRRWHWQWRGTAGTVALPRLRRQRRFRVAPENRWPAQHISAAT